MNAIAPYSESSAPAKRAPRALESLAFADPDDYELVKLWLKRRASNPKTRRAYLYAVELYLASADRRLRSQGMADVDRFADALQARELSPAYRAKLIAAIASLWSFGAETQYLRFNAAAGVARPKPPLDRGARILSAGQVNELIYGEPHPRNRLLLRTLYVAAPRVEEAEHLRWRDVQTGADAEFVRFLGKGEKERYVRIPTDLWSALLEIRGAGDDEAPVFLSRTGGPLCARQMERIVKRAGARVHVDMTPHWLRHSHATHALERGCPLHVVRDTLGHASIRTTGIYLHARPTESSALYLAA
ncbi:MAG TPA: tyrosine-type recombinase/integrase [Candidatus Acidoferrales bacterium]|nr:tyrosine-type recombinase/integrase [Candidatus Acidoferrales bacterium]